jgi:hypothetical protein
MSPVGVGPENDCDGKGAAIINDGLILSDERMLRKDYDRKRSAEKSTGRESHGACRQDELIGGKPPVVKKLWLWLWLRRSCRAADRNSGSRQSRELESAKKT